MLSSRKPGWWLCAFLAVLPLACSKQTTPTSAPSAAGSANSAATYKATGDEGSISGTLSFTGAVPAAKPFNITSDPVCQAAGQIVPEELVVNDGKLQNGFVYVKSGLPTGVSFPPAASEATLNQRGCRYVPHVLGLHTGTRLKLESADQTNHNIHPLPAKNREWNETIFSGSDPITRQFSKPEVMIKVKCGIHSWMLAYIGVLDHPFFAVTDSAGKFSLKGLPPGAYELEAWHEKLGAQTLKVTVPAKAEAQADFTFKAATAYQAGSLQMLPAMVLP